MCIICLEFQRTKDLTDARRMLAAARREPSDIPATHLDEVERQLTQNNQAGQNSGGPTPSPAGGSGKAQP